MVIITLVESFIRWADGIFNEDMWFCCEKRNAVTLPAASRVNFPTVGVICLLSLIDDQN